jgi:serine/threonine protein kinase
MKEGTNEDLSNEVRILRSLRHPNIVLFMGVAVTETTRFIVTELMLGDSLDKLLYTKGRMRNADRHSVMRFERKVELLLDVVKGMLYLHGLQPAIIHRDLKPSVSVAVCTNSIEHIVR